MSLPELISCGKGKNEDPGPETKAVALLPSIWYTPHWTKVKSLLGDQLSIQIGCPMAQLHEKWGWSSLDVCSGWAQPSLSCSL